MFRYVSLCCLCLSIIATQAFGSCLYMETFTAKNDSQIFQSEPVAEECKLRCKADGGVWSGYWNTDGESRSICQCYKLQQFTTKNDEPIWSDIDANTKCPERCIDEEGSWTGGWWTTVFNKNSVCECNKKTINVICDEDV